MLQQYATAAGSKIWMLDLSTSPPGRILMDYSYGAEAAFAEPSRWKAEQMSDADHILMIAEAAPRLEARAKAAEASRKADIDARANPPASPYGWNRPA